MRKTSQETIRQNSTTVFTSFFSHALLIWASLVHVRFVHRSGKLPGKLGPAHSEMHCSCLSLNWKDKFEAPGNWQDTSYPLRCWDTFKEIHISCILMIAHTEALDWKCLKAKYDLDIARGILILYSWFFFCFLFFCDLGLL